MGTDKKYQTYLVTDIKISLIPSTNTINSIILAMIQYILLFSRQGKLRLQKWFSAIPLKEKKKIARDLTTMILSRKPKMCSFLEYKELKVVYKRYVEVLDKYFGNVCELDIIFNFENAYYVLDEL